VLRIAALTFSKLIKKGLNFLAMVVKSKNNNKKVNVPVLFILIAVGMLFTNSTSAQGDLLIFPKRIVFDGNKKVEKIILSNTGKDSAVYNISFIQYKMTELGGLKAITEPDSGQHFASPYLRVFPRQVTLAPNESQTVKLQLINTNNLEDGEYRSHLYFRPDKNIKPLGQEPKTKDSTAISVKLEAIFGISIAIIINKGTYNTIASISELNYTNENNSDYFLNFSINRSGNMSTYGDISIYYISNDNNSYEVRKASGVAVYTPGTIRRVKMQLQKPEGVNFTGGKFKVVYTVSDSKKVIATAEQEF
jgi:P pilus assembly chaperone PapD